MKVAIMSDSHENWRNLSEAIEVVNQKGCTELIFFSGMVSFMIWDCEKMLVEKLVVGKGRK